MSGSGRPKGRLPIARFLGRPETLVVLALTFALAIASVIARDNGPFQAIEGAALDWRFRVRGPQAPAPEVTIVAIDDRTLAELGRWPFTRAWLARTVDAVAADGARTIVFDLLLFGSKARGADPAGQTTGAPREDEVLGDATDTADRALVEAISRAVVVVPFAFVFDPDEANSFALPEAVETAAYRVVRSHPGRHVELPGHPAGVLVPPTPFLAAGRPAHVTVFLEADGSLRFAHPVIRYGDAYYPSLPIEAARLALGAERDHVALELGLGLSIGDRFLPTDHRMGLAINYRGPAGTFETRSLIDIVNGNFPAGHFRDKIVLIGATAVGVGDRFVTPFSPRLPGVEVFAGMIDNVLSLGFLRRSSATERLDLLAVALGGLLAASVGMLRPPALALLGTIGLIGGWSAINLYSFAALQTWLNFTFPSLAIVLGAGVVIVGQTVREYRRRTVAEQQRERLSRYISPLTTVGLQGRADSASSEGSQMAAIMFADLVGFTQASETMTPAGTAGLLRRFHDCVERTVQANHGVIDKFVGDAALAVFGVPAAGPSDAANAVICARRIAAEMADWTADRESADEAAVACSIGVHFGPVAIAEVGGRVHAQITVTGDTVNVASRLEALTRSVRTTIIISDAVMETARAAGAADALDGFEGLPAQRIRGRDRPIGIWAWPAPLRE